MRTLLVVAILMLSTSVFAEEQLADQANKAYQAQQWASAAEMFQKLTVAEPTNSLYWYRLGNSSRHAGDLGKAEAAFKQASQLGFQPMYVALGLAAVNTLKGDRDKALTGIETLAKNGAPVAPLIEADETLKTLSNEPRYIAALASMKEQAAPCKSPKNPQYRQFDFWAGDWDVFGKGGALVGHSAVKVILGDCVIYENWTDGVGNEGKSFNKYNANMKRWEQYWVDQYGSTTHYVGNLENGNMVYLSDSFTPQGQPAKLRLTFFPLPEGKVRQFGETSSDDGKTWTVSYDLTYVRHQ